MSHTQKWLLAFLLIFQATLPVFSQNKVWRHYGIRDGLPGNTVYDMLQDSRGFMWFVTDKGICSFNGYEFDTPEDTSTQAGVDAYLPTEDHQGRIWFVRIDNSIWYIEKDTIRAWPFNNILKDTLVYTRIIDQIAITEDESLWLGINGLGFMVVSPLGDIKILRGADGLNITCTTIRNKNIFSRQSGRTEYSIGENNSLSVLILKDTTFKRISELPIKNFKNTFDATSAWNLGEELMLVYADGQYFLFHRNKLSKSFSSTIVAEKIVQTRKGELLLASHLLPGAGLHYSKSIDAFAEGQTVNLLNGFLCTYAYEDPLGGWWVSTKNSGIFYCKNPTLEIYDDPFLPKGEVVCLADDGANTIYAGLPKSGIYKLSVAEGNIEHLGKSSQDMDLMALHFDQKRKRLWSSVPLSHWTGRAWQINPFTNAKDFSPGLPDRVLWMSSTFGFYALDLETARVTDYRLKDDPSTQIRTYNVAQDFRKTLWVATVNGLRVWKEDHYEDPPFKHEALEYPVRDIALLDSQYVAFAFLGKGILILDADWHTIHLTKQSGLCSDNISKIKVFDDGRMYACSSEGFSQLTLGKEGWKLKNFTTRQGLPSNVVNDIVAIGPQIWVASDQGLFRLDTATTTYGIPTPIFNQVLVDRQSATIKEGMKLSYHQNNISIEYYSLYFRSEGDILYRYKLNAEDTVFQYTSSREVYFPELAPGQYRFEVQAQGEDDVWSPSATWTFEIRPPWWQTWWFILGIAGVLAVLIRAAYVNRLKTYREKTEIRNKIKDLELAALRAQINPHFIFNCLGSIQQYITENDKEAANRYLARFAKLIRLSLHSAVDGQHSLQDEIEMLDSYLSLEQMRFKEKLNYSIKVSPDLSTDEILLPPLLIQPIIENAVKHGIRHNQDGGIIRVEFTKQDHQLKIEITDNGPGFSLADIHANPAHKSLGMSLTRNRLELLQEEVNRSSFTQENIQGPNGETIGSWVTIMIPID